MKLLKPRQWSLRARLSIVVLIIAGLGLLATNVVALTQLRGYLIAQVDDQLVRAASGPVLRLDEFGITGNNDDDSDNDRRVRRGRIPSSLSVAVLDTQGNVLGRYGGELNSNSNTPDFTGLTIQQVAANLGKPFTLNAVNGETHFRAVARVVIGGTSSVVVTQPLTEVEDTLWHLMLLLLLISLGVLALLAAVSRGVVGLGMKPLRQVEETAESIAAGDLSARLPDADASTEVGRLTQSLNTMLTRIEDAFRVRTESEEQLRRFVADASHELRTPLTAIRGFAELAKKGMVPADEATERIERESMRMTTLVEDLLLLARLDQQRPLMREPVNMGLLLDEVVEAARAAGPKHPIELDLPDQELIVEGDNVRLHQVVANLLTNARTHTADGTPIYVGAAKHDDQIRITVRDRGEGIPAENLSRIFERFYRADSSRARGADRDNGSGLGLSIVKAIVEAHNGTVSVKSAAGEGTEFTLTLPISL